MKIRHLVFGVVNALLILSIACSDSDSVDNVPPRQTVPPADYTFVHFDLAAQDPAQIPIPNDLLRNPATGRLALPLFGLPAVDALISQINTLSGFSTSAAIRLPFAGKVDPASVNDSTLIVADLADLAASANPRRAIRWEVREDESGESSVLFGFPIRPLTPGHPHVVVVTSGVLGQPSGLPVESEAFTLLLKSDFPFVDPNGNSTRPVFDNATAQALEPVRQAYQSIWSAAEAVTGQGRNVIPFAFAFTTQPLFNTLAELRKRAQELNPVPVVDIAVVGFAQVDAILNAVGFGAVPHDSVFALILGRYDSPLYLSDPLNGPFQGEGPDLVQTGVENINFIVALPEGTGPFPTVIFQHGITRVKEDGIALINAANANGMAVVGIDLVLHGQRSPDLINNTTGEPGPDGLPDPSGDFFINLTNLLMSRDNIRQSVSDLFVLTRMITSGVVDLDGNGTPELSPENILFIGTSLGGIVGGPFVTMEPNVRLANLNVAGGRIAYLLNNSPTFGPAIDAGLTGVGLTPGTPLYDLFYIFAQTIVDDADPFNYLPYAASGSLASGAGTSILVQEIIDDMVVPNSATSDLARAGNLTQIDALVEIEGLSQNASPFKGSGIFQFEGSHGAILDPSFGPTAEIQTQSITFLLTGLLDEPTVVNPSTLPALKGIEPGSPGIELDLKPETALRLPKN